MSDDAPDGDEDDPAFDSLAVSDDGRSVDDVVELLAHQRARRVVSYLESVPADAVEFEDVVDYVVERETEDAERRAQEEAEGRRQSVAVALHHNRLPKLDAAGVLDYDPRSKTVRYWGGDRIERLVDLFESEGES